MEGDNKVFVVVDGCKRLNVRKKSNKASDVLCVVSAGDTLEVKSSLNNTNPWVRITTEDDITGFVMKEFVKEK